MKSRYANAGTLVDGNDQNRLKAHYIYDAFGNQLNTSFDNLPVPNPLRYRGNEGYLLVYGQDTLLSFSLYNAGARTYDTGTGRWLQADPIVGVLDDPMSFNRYLYCDADPVNNEDPSGLRYTENANGPTGPNGQYASRGPNAKKSRYCPGYNSCRLTPADYAWTVAGYDSDAGAAMLSHYAGEGSVLNVAGPAVDMVCGYNDYVETKEKALSASRPRYNGANQLDMPDIQEDYNSFFPGLIRFGLSK